MWAEAIRKKKILTINDFSCDDPKKKGLPEGHVPLTRLMVVPCIKEDKVISVVAVANKKTDYLAEDEEQVLAFLNNVQLLIDKKAAEQEAAEMATQLHQAQKIEAIGRLAGGVAHDFNNMLSVITGYAEMALEETLPSQPIYEKLEKIKEAGERSADLTRQLLAFARKQNISPKVLDCNEVIENMTSMLNRLVGEHIDLIWQPDKKIWPAKIDRSQIEQILANLCVNAKDAIADLGKIIIETGNATFDQDYCNAHPECIPGEYIMLAISDDGHGMDSGTLENIFEPFYTTKGPGEGTGLGLATVYGVVRQNQGFVNVYSEPGQGTTFKIYLPRFKTKSGSMPEESGKKSIEVGHETILLVEDEVAILEMAEQMLNRLGYRVITAKTPGEAIRLAQEHFGEIQLLLSDVIMPEMNGRDLAKNILSVYPNVKRLFMSGYTANIIAHHGVLDEGINFIQKPFSSHELGTKIREVLDKDKS